MIRSIFPLLAAAAILLAANALLGTLIALRAGLEGFDPSVVGLTGAFYFTGFFAASYFASRLIKAVGHVRLFAAMAAIGAVGPLLMVMIPHAIVWMLVRAIGGFCFSALLMVVESWINDVSKNTDRARVLSIYRIVDLVAVTSTQFMIPIVGEGGYEIFAIISIMFCLSLVPVALSNRSRPRVPDALKLDLSAVWQISPLACLTCLAIGLTNSAFRLVGPVYGIAIGLNTQQVVYFMTAGIIGGAVLQYPFGHFSDTVGRRKTVLAATVGAMTAAVFLSLQPVGAELMVYIGIFLFGAFALPLYSLAAAHANDRATPGQYVLIAAGLTFFFSIGAVIGPFAASTVIEQFGANAFFIYTCVVHGSLMLVVLLRLRARESVPAEQRSRFVALLRTSPDFFRMARRMTRQRHDTHNNPDTDTHSDSKEKH